MQYFDKVETVVAAENDLGEGPIWDGRCGQFYWLDITAEQLHVFQPDTHQRRTVHLGSVPGSIHLCDSPSRLLLTSTDGLLEVDVDAGKVVAITEPLRLPAGCRFNDGKTDPTGNIWAGVMHFDCLDGRGALHYLSGRSSSRLVLDGMTVPNGLAWSGDGKTFYHIDSPRLSVMAYDFDQVAGALSAPREAIRFADDGSCPDGMCIDENDNLWVTFWDGARVDCFNPRSGRRLASVSMPVNRVTSCCFGGEGMRELYITSARYRLDQQQLSCEPLAGALFKVDVGVSGVAEAVTGF